MGKNVTISTLPNIGQNYLPKINTSSIFANSLVYDDGSSVLINTTTASAFRLDVNGSIRATSGTLTGALSGTSATFSGDVNITNSSNAQIGFNTTGALNTTGAYLYYNRSGSNKWTSGMGPVDGSNDFQIATGSVKALNLTVTTGAATFSSSVTAGGDITVSKSGDSGINLNSTTTNGVAVTRYQTTAAGNLWATGINITNSDSRWEVYNFALGVSPFRISTTGAATFSGKITTPAAGIQIGGAVFCLAAQDANGMFLEQTGNTTNTSKLRLQSSKSGDGTNYSQFFVDPTNGFSFQTIGTGNGNVGIGTSSPLQTAANRVVTTINGTSSAILNLSVGGTLRTYYYADSSSSTLETVGTNTISASGANIIAFNTNGSERMRITSGFSVSVPNNTATTLFNIATVLSNGSIGIVSVSNATNGIGQATVLIQKDGNGNVSQATIGTQPVANYFSFSLSGTNLQITTAISAGTFTIIGTVVRISS